MNWIFFPLHKKIPDHLSEVVLSFEKNSTDISSAKNDSNDTRLKSDEVLRIISKDLINIGYEVELSKRKRYNKSTCIICKWWSNAFIRSRCL